MSIIRDETIKIVAQILGIENIGEEVPRALAPEVEFRLREIIQEALKFCTHSKRQKLTSKDINDALRSRNMEKLYGFSGTSKQNYIPVEGTNGLFFLEDKEIDISCLLNTSMPNCPAEPGFNVHWFAVDGIQPKIPENEPMGKDLDTVSSALEKQVATETEHKPLVKHVLSGELQLYYSKVTSAVKGEDYEFQQAAFASLSGDPGLHQLLPYLSKFIYDEVQRNNMDLGVLSPIMRMTKCLLSNPYLHIELYLHQLLPAILTCVVGKQLCLNPADNHWGLREYGARLVAQICERFGEFYENLRPRISKTYYEAFSNPQCPLTTQYGGIIGVMFLGPLAMELLLFPSLTSILSRLEPLCSSTNEDVAQRLEAQNCYGGIVHATGRYIQICSQSRQWDPQMLEVINKLNDTFGESLLPYQRDKSMDWPGNLIL